MGPILLKNSDSGTEKLRSGVGPISCSSYFNALASIMAQDCVINPLSLLICEFFNRIGPVAGIGHFARHAGQF